MSKNTLLISAIVIMSAIGYYFGPDLVRLTHKDQRAAETTPAATVAGQNDQQLAKPTAPVPARPTVIVEKATTSTLKAPVKMTKAEVKPARTVALRRKGAVQRAQTAEERRLPAAPFTAQRPERATAPDDYAPRVSPAKLARRERNFENPMEHRWVKELSGQSARLDLAKKKDELAPCRQATAKNSDYACERKSSKEDVSVAGVIVKSETLASHPATPIEGDVTRGSYDQETPAVYVK